VSSYSGVAGAWSGDPDNVNIVTNWSTRGRNLSHIRDDAKAPTALYYDGDKIYWGHSITEDEDAIRWFKLLLLKDEDLQDDIRQSPFLKKAKRKLDELGITPEEAVADYLSLLWDHTLSSMKRVRGASAIEGLPFKVVLTVPAIWKPYAHEKMREAAHAAGILNHRPCGKTTLKLVSEPEAAALATLNEFRDRHDINKGDVYVVCDVGGGTADIISYRIKETGPLILYESVEGKGKLCGAMFVDETFQSLIKSRIGQQRWEKLSRASKVKLMNDEWEFGIKRAFDGEPNRSWTCQLPPDAVARFSSHRLDDRKADAPMIRGQIQFNTYVSRLLRGYRTDFAGQ
jgi:molecular chaperone DnaK (HSP70)